MSPIQNRNVKRPVRAALGVSKTMSYVPGAGRTAAEEGFAAPNPAR